MHYGQLAKDSQRHRDPGPLNPTDAGLPGGRQPDQPPRSQDGPRGGRVTLQSLGSTPDQPFSSRSLIIRTGPDREFFRRCQVCGLTVQRKTQPPGCQ